MKAEEKTKQRLNKGNNAKEVADAVTRDDQAEFANEFPNHPPEKGMNKRQHRQKKQ